MPRDTRDDRLHKLIEHGPERLAQALLDLAARDDRAHDLVEQLLTTPAESSARVYRRLDGLRHDKRFFGRRGAPSFAAELRSILADIEAATPDPREGLELVAAFYRSDSQAFEMADDSDGDIGEVYRYAALQLWTAFADACDDKDWLIGLVLDLREHDGYGVRDAILESASEYLPEEAMRTLIAKLRARAGPSDHAPLYAAAGLAKQILDPELFESITKESDGGDLPMEAHAELAQIYLGLGNPAAALECAKNMPEGRFHTDEKRKVLLSIHQRLGNLDQAKEIAWTAFRERRSTESLEALVAVIGEDQREHALDESVELIANQETFDPADACFLAAVGRRDEAEACLLRNAKSLNGDRYSQLLYLAETMEDGQRHVCASILYRALLDSILRRAKSKTYGHAAKYLRKLVALAKLVRDWGGVEDHHSYRSRLEEQHRRKHAFWKLVQG